jgi:quercetin dioxygenase-like cupin family protein
MPNSALIYATVLEGAIRSQVNDQPVTADKAGQSFSELVGDRLGVSECQRDEAGYCVGSGIGDAVEPAQRRPR